MTIETLPAGYCVDFSSTQQVDFAIKENDFTAGYTARDADGINNVRDTWNVSFSQLTLAEMEVVWDFLDTKKGYISFFWTPPRETSPRRWTCLKLTRSAASSNAWTVQAVFQEQFNHYVGEVTNHAVPGVVGTGHVGSFTFTLTFAPGTVGVSGIEATGIAADIFPSQVIQEYFSANDAKTYTDAVIQGDYMYAFYGWKHITKIHVPSFKAVDLFDIDEMSSLGTDTGFPFAERRMAADSNYLYVNSHNTGKILRILLSDFRTTSIKNMALVNAAYAGLGGMFVYNGKLWMLPSETSGFTGVVRLDTSDFTTVDFLDWSSLVIAGSPLALVQGFVVWDHYCTCIMGRHRAFFFDENDTRSLQFDLNNFTVGGVKLLDISGMSNHHWIKGRGSYDGSGYVYFTNTSSAFAIRINTAHTVVQESSAFPETPEGDFFAGCGTWITGTDLFILSSYTQASALMKIDLTSSGSLATMTNELIDVPSYALGENPDGLRARVAYKDIYGDSDWIYCLADTTNSGFNTTVIRNNVPGIMRVQTSQGAYWSFPSQTGSELFTPGIQNWYWAGDDFSYLLPADTTSWTRTNVIYDGTTSANRRVYVLAISMKFGDGSSGGTISSVSLGGTPCTKIVDTSIGENYAGIWYVVSGTNGKDLIIETSDAVHYYDAEIYAIDGGSQTPSFVGTPISGTGTDATFTYDVDDGGTIIGAITVDATPTDWNVSFDDPNFGNDNTDWWGPELPDWTNTVFDIQFSNDEGPSAAVTGGSVTVDWNVPGVTESLPWVGCIVAFNVGVTAPSIDKYIRGTIAQGYPGIILNPVFI